jgi:hypothetical protein
MKIKKENRTSIIKEIKFSIEKMKEAEDPKAKLYYFSAVYGIIQRIFNIDYDDDLVFIHFVLQSTYNNINMRMQNPDPVIKMPEDLLIRLIADTEELLGVIEKNGNSYEVLKRFVLLGYITAGNGFYLYQKGLLKI